MSPTAIEKSFCTTREAAILLGVSVGTVQLWVETGVLHAWKTAGGHRRVLRNSVEHLLHKKPTLPSTHSSNAVAVAVSERLRILVVEDDPNLLRLYDAQICRWPMPTEVTLIDNAINALLHMGRGGPDLLVSDLHMPGMDGFVMLRALHKAPEMASTTVVVVTGLDLDEVNARGGVPPSVVVLEKPIPFAQLLSIAQVISTRLGIAQQVH